MLIVTINFRVKNILFNINRITFHPHYQHFSWEHLCWSELCRCCNVTPLLPWGYFQAQSEYEEILIIAKKIFRIYRNLQKFALEWFKNVSLNCSYFFILKLPPKLVQNISLEKRLLTDHLQWPCQCFKYKSFAILKESNSCIDICLVPTSTTIFGKRTKSFDVKSLLY